MKQIKNHRDSTKADWKALNKLREKEIGLAWDYVKTESLLVINGGKSIYKCVRNPGVFRYLFEW